MSALFLLVMAPAAIWWGAMAGAMWIAARHSRGLVWTVSGLGMAVLLLVGLDLTWDCATPPTVVAPTPAEEAAGSVGRATHACDGPGGAIVQGFARITLPVAAMGQALLTWWSMPRG